MVRRKEAELGGQTKYSLTISLAPCVRRASARRQKIYAAEIESQAEQPGRAGKARPSHSWGK